MTLTHIQRLFSCISGLWVGSFICVGFLVVPVLFASLGDRQVAGFVAANLFKICAYASVGLSSFLMLMANRLVRRSFDTYRPLRWILLGMLACAISEAFVIIPWMNSLRDQALFLGLSVRESSYAILFSRLHHISSGIFLVQTVLGLILVWRATKNAD
jgi:hypothetical protein